MKSKFKFLITLVLLIVLTSSCLCFATNNNDIMLISNTAELNEKKETAFSDVYLSNSDYEINNNIDGNVYATVDSLTISSKDNGGNINGSLFATANEIHIKSNITYSETEKDELGNPTISSVNSFSSISGNAFIITNKFILDPACKIDGDLYILAEEIYLGQNSSISGNVFAIAKSLNIDGKIEGDLYANVENFEMKYYGFIRRDLHLNSETTNINGYIKRNSFIFSENIVLSDRFINEKDFNVENAKNLSFSGEVKGNANINCKEITFDTTKTNCIIRGNLNYSSKEQLDLENGIILKEVFYNEYKESKNNIILDYILYLITTLVFTFVIYLLISKFASKFIKSFTDLTYLSLLKTLVIGLIFLILIPIVSILLFISNIGSILGFILVLIYIILLILTKPIFIIGIATFIKNKLSYKLNIYLYILGITVILSLINLVPYIGFIFSILVTLTGFGMITKNLIPNK